MRLLFLTYPLPILALEAPTRAPWPVWSGSTAKPVRFAPLAEVAALSKRSAVRLWHRARDFDRGTHQPGRHGGAVGHVGLAVLHTLIFEFLNHRTGRLDPFYAAIAAKAGVCVRTVATALKRLRELGILNWVRRCAETWRDGRFVLEQETNAYAVQAALEGELVGQVQALASDPKDGLAAALARLGRAFMARDS